MPIRKEVLEKYVSPTFVETGTYHGETVALAKTLGFGAIHTMDIEQGYADNGKGVNAYCGDSPDILAKILPGIDGPITFWLDAHPLITPMSLFLTHFPLMRELLAIKQHAKTDHHAILMDDMRTFTADEQAILEASCKILWPGAQISRENGIATDDIMVCLI